MSERVEKRSGVAWFEPSYTVYLSDVRPDHRGGHRLAEESGHCCGPAISLGHDFKTAPRVTVGSNRDLRCHGLGSHCLSVLNRAGPRSGAHNDAVRHP
jgi:hypothetical protein